MNATTAAEKKDHVNSALAVAPTGLSISALEPRVLRNRLAFVGHKPGSFAGTETPLAVRVVTKRSYPPSSITKPTSWWGLK